MPPVQAPEQVASLFGDIHGVEYRFSTAAEGQPAWAVRTLNIVETISEAYVIALELGSEDAPRNPAAMLGKSCTVTVSRAAERYVHGVVSSIEDGVSTASLTVVHLTIVPALAALKHVSSSRIFPEVAIGDLVLSELEKAFKPFKREAALDLMQTEYPKREYIVQHRETDLSFFDRILAEQGLWYYFDHPAGDDQAERLVITDSPQKAPAIAEEPELELLRERDRSPTQEAITSFALRDAIGTNGVRVRQFNWTHPEVVEDIEKSAADSSGLALAAYEHGDIAGYDYQKPRYRKHDSEAQAQLRLERHQRDRQVYRGESNAVLMRPGHFMRVEGKEYLITRVSHVGSTVFNVGSAAHRGEYRNSFECVLRERAYRPQLSEKPRIVGVQTARVVGRDGGIEAPTSSAQGEDIVTDEHGRVRVKFAWDLTAAGKGGTSSCWVRVAQGWAGAGWGTQFIPRVGMEVVVQFIDGDPDRPLITGCVYNGLNPPPYKDKPTQSGIKTASSVDPSRYNELRFEDAKDQEQIFVRAQKDYEEEVLNDHKTTVHANQTQVVQKNQSETVSGSASLSVGGSRSKSVSGEESIKVKGTRTTTIVKKNTDIFQDEYEQTVTAAVTITHNDTRTTTIKKDDIESITDGNKATSVVSGSYEVRSSKALTLVQDGKHALQLDGKAHLQTSGEFSITNDKCLVESRGDQLYMEAKSAVSIGCGQATLELKKDGTINITGVKIGITAGNNSIVADQTGVTVSGVKVSSTAVGIHEIQGAMIKIG